VYEEHCRRRIIVMEYVEGVSVADKERWQGRGNDPVIIARRLIELYFEQFVSLRLLHFDPHPGNIYVLDNNRIALLDYGMSGEITEKMSESVKESLRAFGRKDYARLLDIMKSLGFLKKDADIYLLLPVVEYFFEEILETVALEAQAVEKVDLSPVAGRLIEILYAQPFRLPFEWAYIGKVIGTLASVVGTLNPKINLYAELKGYIDRLSKASDAVGAVLEVVKTTVKETVALPGRVTSLLNRIDRGRLKFPVDFEEVDEKIVKLGATFARGVGFLIAFFSVFFAYLSHVLGRPEGLWVFGGVAIVALLFAVIYRKQTKREAIKKMMEKHAKASGEER
jgi:predicted unusual protein kinase regulating ubiquinone biosynthesis (AarF/ABC1/UbiB family)